MGIDMRGSWAVLLMSILSFISLYSKEVRLQLPVTLKPLPVNNTYTHCMHPLSCCPARKAKSQKSSLTSAGEGSFTLTDGYSIPGPQALPEFCQDVE